MKLKREIQIAILFEGGIGLVALTVAFVLGIDLVDQIEFTWEDSLWGIVAVFPLFISLWLLTRIRWRPFDRILRELDQRILPWFGNGSLWELALVSILAGVGEEVLFRGLLQTQVSNSFGVLPGLVAASILFGLAHLLTPLYGILAGLVGLYLGGIFLLSGNLWIPIVAHALYDFLALLFLMRRAPFEGKEAESG